MANSSNNGFTNPLPNVTDSNEMYNSIHSFTLLLIIIKISLFSTPFLQFGFQCFVHGLFSLKQLNLKLGDFPLKARAKPNTNVVWCLATNGNSSRGTSY